MQKLAASCIRSTLGALALLGLIVVSVPVLAQQANSGQPGNSTASSVMEEQLLREMRIISGRGTLPDVKSYNLIQPDGRDWRSFHEVALHWIGGVAIFGMLGVLVVYYLIRGSLRVDAGLSGRIISRFNGFERFVHWLTAISFVALGLTGLNFTFGKDLLLPLIGPESFSAWSQWAKYSHNYLGVAFTLGTFAMFLTWITSNLPSKVDIEWLKAGGGMLGGGVHPPAGRFNAGQKILFWMVMAASTAVVVTGYLLMFPFYATAITGMQLAEVFHGTVAVLFIALILGHIYLGTIGMQGAFETMWGGTADLNWLKQHHSAWYEENVAGKPAAASSPQGGIGPVGEVGTAKA
jgi:formate dehydrogenase subunit gamma